MSVVVIEDKPKGHGCLVTLLWFVFIGSWLSGLWITIAWLFVALIITMPVGLAMINKVPLIATLREPTREYRAVTEGLATRIQRSEQVQSPFILRALYFVFVGWWFSGIWLGLAWLASVTLIGLPLAIWMYNRVPALTTLKRY